MSPPALQRSDTFASYWSDAGEIGATFDLHAVAKPFMKMLHHRQARETIKARSHERLTKDYLSVLTSYLRFKYLFLDTRVLVLEELLARSKRDASEAELIAAALLPDEGVIEHLLQCSKMKLVVLARELMDALGSETGSEGQASSGLSRKRSSTSYSQPDWDAQLSASTSTTSFSRTSSLPLPERASSTDSLASLISLAQAQSSSDGIEWDSDEAVELVGDQPDLHADLVALLDSDDATVCARAWFGLSYISDTLTGAREVVNSGALHYAVRDLAKFREGECVQWTCLVMGNVAHHRSTLGSILDEPAILERLVELASHRIAAIRRSAILALHNITRWREGVQAIFALGILDKVHVEREEDAGILYWTARLLGNLAKYASKHERRQLRVHIQRILEHSLSDKRVLKAATIAMRTTAGSCRQDSREDEEVA
ncbi:hypothetical protein MKEN_01322900 [Mycena kentingensis (nom. inval.)]|nr:hypothetical protein MKEN_01322900 [Mycena kentingensis (nom. inval.)]